MFIGISAADWLQLWNGFIGALVAAVAAALVAWGVVKATNKHQSRLAYVAARQAAREAQRSRVIDAMSEFLTIVDESHLNIDELTKASFKPYVTRLWTLVHTLGLVGGLGMNIRNLVFMWPAMIRELVYQYIDSTDENLRTETKDALRNVHSAFAVTLPSFIGDEEFDVKSLMGIVEEAYETGKSVLLDTSGL